MHKDITVNDVIYTVTKVSLTTLFDINTTNLCNRNCEVNDIDESLLNYVVYEIHFLFDFDINEYRCLIWTFRR